MDLGERSGVEELERRVRQGRSVARAVFGIEMEGTETKRMRRTEKGRKRGRQRGGNGDEGKEGKEGNP